MSVEEVDRAYELYRMDGTSLQFVANLSSLEYPYAALEKYANNIAQPQPGTYWMVEHKSYGSSVTEFEVRAETRYVVERVERPGISEALEAQA